MELTEGQRDVMKADGHLLVTGGPGSGKTTVSIIKAAQIVEQVIRPGQKILFLSFARATVSRVVEAIEYEQNISVAAKRLIEVDTYHAFFWRVLKTHGYLIGLPRRLDILTLRYSDFSGHSCLVKFINRSLYEDIEKDVHPRT